MFSTDLPAMNFKNADAWTEEERGLSTFGASLGGPDSSNSDTAEKAGSEEVAGVLMQELRSVDNAHRAA